MDRNKCPFFVIAAIVFNCVTGYINSYGKTGFPLILKCPLSSSSGFTWRGPPNLRIYSNNGYIVPALKKHVNVSRNSEEKTTMIIKKLTKATTGLYQCETILNGQAAEQEIRVIVSVAPEIWRIYYCQSEHICKNELWPKLSSPKVRVDEGSFQRLTCSTISCGMPQGVINWIGKNRNETKDCFGAPPIKVMLELNITSSDHKTKYVCAVDNGYHRKNQSVTLLVNSIPTVQILTDSPSEVAENLNVTLTCESTTNTNPVTLRWKFNNRILRNNKTVMVIINTGPDDFGRYICEASNRIGMRDTFVDIFIRHKPLPFTDRNSSKLIFEAEVNQPTIVSTMVRSFPKPECSWTKDKGGKLSIINVQHVQLNVYNIKASVLVQNDEMLGAHSMRVRNELGALDLTFDIISRTITTYPQKAYCNVSNTLTLSSTIHSYQGEEWTSMWNHRIRGQLIRSIPGDTAHNVSTLEINFCDYRDAGCYYCHWTSTSKTFTSYENVEVIVYGPPIFASHGIVKAGSHMIRFEFSFYSIPEPLSIVWLKNDKIFKQNETHITSNKRRKVSIRNGNREIQVGGYVATLTLDLNLAQSFNISCIVSNEFGNRDTLFTQDYIREVVAEMTPSEGPMSMNKRILFIVGGASLTCLVIITVVVIKSHRRVYQCFVRKDQTFPMPAAEEDNQAPIRPASDDQELQEFNTDDYGGYEEISNIQPSIPMTEDQRQAYIDMNNGETSGSTNPLNSPVYLDLESEKPSSDLNSSKSDADSYTRDYLDPKTDPYEDLGSNKSDHHLYNTYDGETWTVSTLNTEIGAD